MCPRKFTLRKLKWMADGKREHDYDVAISTITYLGDSFAGEFKPGSANPIRNQRTEELIRSSGRDSGKEGFMVLGMMLERMVKEAEANGESI